MTENKSKRGIIIIYPTVVAITEKRRVAAYCRVSSSSDEQLDSFAAQLGYYDKLIAEHVDWELVDIYAEKENINTAEMGGEMFLTMFSGAAQQESISISGNMRWSYLRRMKSGNFITCKAPFGYRSVDGTLEVDETEAKMVCHIFEGYLQGKSRQELATEMQQGTDCQVKCNIWKREPQKGKDSPNIFEDECWVNINWVSGMRGLQGVLKKMIDDGRLAVASNPSSNRPSYHRKLKKNNIL